MKSKIFSHLYSPAFLTALFVALYLGAPQRAAASAGPEREFSKTISREFTTNANGATALYNRYGKVNVNTWNNKSVKIDITIIVNTNDQRSADRVFDKIKINFTNTIGYVKAETVIEEIKAGGWGADCRDFKINYEVWMPIGNQLDLKNKYGNTYVSELNGKLLADIKYGDLFTEAINNDAEIMLGYGKCSLAKVKNLSAQVSYGGISVSEADDIQIDSKYSEFNVEKAGNIRFTSKYDDFKLGTVDDLKVQTKYANLRVQNARSSMITAQYTDIKLENVGEYFDADLSYGGLKINQLARSFREVSIVGKYSNVELNVERGAAFRFDTDVSYAGARYPQAATVRLCEDSENRRVSSGFVGSNDAKGIVKARLRYGDLTIQQY
jgi:hypothetical protein